MKKFLFVVNSLGSDNWMQIYIGDCLFFDGLFDGALAVMEKSVDALRLDGMEVEVEYVTDDEMAEYAE